MLIPHFVAREHGLFGGHESEDIRTILILVLTLKIFFRLSFNQNGRKNAL